MLTKRNNFNTVRPQGTTDTNSNSPLTSELEQALVREHAEFLLRKQEYDKWAAETKVGDAMVPYANVAFRDLFICTKHPTSGKNCVEINRASKKQWIPITDEKGFVNAFIDAFSMGRYDGKLVVGQHTRMFDASLPVALGVMNVKENGAWHTYKWQARSFQRQGISDDQYRAEQRKHDTIDIVLLSLAQDMPIRCTFNFEDQWERFQRNVVGRLDLTVAEAIIEKSEDAATSQAARVARKGGETISEPVVSLVVEGVDLVTSPIAVIAWVTTPLTSKPYSRPFDPKNPKDMADAQWIVEHADQGYALSLKAPSK